MRTGQCWDQRLAAAGMSPLGSLPLRGPGRPAAPPPPVPTPALLTARSFITHTPLHTHSTPRAGASRRPPTPAPAPELHPSGSGVFPSSQVPNALLCPAPLPGRASLEQAAAANTAPPHCSTQLGQEQPVGSVRGGYVPPKWGSPILSPVLTHTHPPLPPGAACQARRTRHRCDPVESGSAVNSGGAAAPW